MENGIKPIVIIEDKSSLEVIMSIIPKDLINKAKFESYSSHELCIATLSSYCSLGGNKVLFLFNTHSDNQIHIDKQIDNIIDIVSLHQSDTKIKIIPLEPNLETIIHNTVNNYDLTPHQKQIKPSNDNFSRNYNFYDLLKFEKNLKPLQETFEIKEIIDFIN